MSFIIDNSRLVRMGGLRGPTRTWGLTHKRAVLTVSHVIIRPTNCCSSRTGNGLAGRGKHICRRIHIHAYAWPGGVNLSDRGRISEAVAYCLRLRSVRGTLENDVP